MTGPLVTIVIPVYNLAPYLKECLDTVQKQSYENFEVMLVNDGSSDSSLELCQIYVRNDRRFRLIDKSNTGVSDSRNRALDHASGKFIQFIDGDDWLTGDATQTLVHTAESTGADLVVSHFYRVSEGRMVQRGHIKAEGIFTRREFAEQMRKAPANFYYGVLWNKLYRRSILEANHLRFDPKVDWCEDFLFNLEYIEHARLIAAVPKPVYYYRKRKSSLVSTQATLRRTIATKKKTFASYKELYQKLDLYEEQKAGIYAFLLSTATDGLVPPLAAKIDPDKTPDIFS